MKEKCTCPPEKCWQLSTGCQLLPRGTSLLEKLYCGCCGNDIYGTDPNWCNRCAQHTEPGRGPLWELTYFAMYGEDCPYQVGI